MQVRGPYEVANALSHKKFNQRALNGSATSQTGAMAA